MKHIKFFILISVFAQIFYSSSNCMELGKANTLFERYSRIGNMIQDFYKQPHNQKNPITEDHIREAYNNFIASLNTKEVATIKQWDKEKRGPHPKWLDKKD